MQARHAGVGGGTGQVDLRVDAPGLAAPPDADLGPGEVEPPLRDGDVIHLGAWTALRVTSG